MPEESAEAKPKGSNKHRKLTCAGCRRRKSKCDGKSPKCTTCIAYKDDCVYDKAPSLAYVRSLEDENHELKNRLKAAKTQVWLSKVRKISPRLKLELTTIQSAAAASNEEQKVLASLSTSQGESPSPTPSVTEPRRDSATSLRGSRQVKWDTDISVDDHGAVSFHNCTSAVHEPPQVQQQAMPTSLISPPSFEPTTVYDDRQTKQNLVLNAGKQKQLENFAIANSANNVNIPKDISAELLRYHWCWIHPLFLFVYRPAFTRGMALIDNSQPGAPDPPYFSKTLLRVMHAHCARFLNHNVYQQTNMQAALSPTQPLSASDFMQQMTHEARIGLGMETLKASSIPTIQALLQQSAREIVFGRSSQGWLYGGMAFRMAFDMGIHLPSDKLHMIVKSLSAEDIEIRKRLFWSCYTWDKVLSLYLGRMPGFTPITEDVPLTFMDDYSDSEPWSPYYGEAPGVDVSLNPIYPPVPGYVVSCFQQLCKLCVILNDLMQNIYAPDATARRSNEDIHAEIRNETESPFVRIASDLQSWWSALPAHLKVRVDLAPALAPPVHIMSLNLLYHSTIILLNRPVLQGSTDDTSLHTSRSYHACLAATSAIHDLILLQSNTYGLSHVSYLNAYSVYTAATIAVLRFERELKVGEDHVATMQDTGLTFLMDVLQRTAASMPALERSDLIIQKRTNAVIERHKVSMANISLPSPSNSSTSDPRTTSISMIAQRDDYQTLSDQTLGHNSYIGHTPQRTQLQQYMQRPNTSASQAFSSSHGSPMQWQPGLQTSMSYDLPQATSIGHSAFPDDWLPAFPGQDFPVGSEHSFGSDEVDTQSRMAMLGFSLDPHPRLHPNDIDWTVMDAFDSLAGDVKFDSTLMR